MGVLDEEQTKTQLERVPLPTATLVIDTRGDTPESYILKTLRRDIKTLCQEMQMKKVKHWRYLTRIIEDRSFGVLKQDELQGYRNPDKLGQDRNNIPDGDFKEKICQILSLCDALRTERVRATLDLDTQGDLGPEWFGDGMVRVILITDAQSEDALATAATYAAYLRNASDEQQPLLSTLVICLNHQNRGEPPKMLMDALSWGKERSWSHIDSCILVESYSEHGARPNDETPEEHIAFLLYILIITNLLQSRIGPDVQLSEKCFSIGLSAFTYSTRWASALLNSDLTQCIAQELIGHAETKSKQDISIIADKWLDEQYAIVKSAIPHQVVGTMPELKALIDAKTMVKSASDVFLPLRLNPDVGERAIKDLDKYANNLKATYTDPISQQASLQDAVLCEPTIRSFVGRWTEDADSPLMTVLNNAYRVLTDPRFFSGARGAMPRAKKQLPEIAAEIAKRQNKHQGSNVNPVNQRNDLAGQQYEGRQRLVVLYQRFPFVERLFRGWLRHLTLLLWVFVAVVVGLLGLAGLHHVASLYAPSIAYLVDSLPLMYYVLVGIFVLLVFFICRDFLLSHKNSPFTIEVFFLLSLILFIACGPTVSLFLVPIAGDWANLGLMVWLSVVLPYVSLWFGILCVLVVVTEVVYFLMWHGEVKREQESIVSNLNRQHLAAVDAVHEYLAEAFLLALMQHAALVDETGLEAGHYDAAIEQLQAVLGDVQKIAEEQNQEAQQHLELIAGNQMLGLASFKLYLREELLDMTALNNHLHTLKLGVHDNPMFVEFTELLLRTLGLEAPAMILRNMEERPRSEKTQCLLSTIAAQALTLSLEQPSPVPPDVDMLKKRYRGLDCRYQYSLIQNLLEQMKIRVASRTSKRKEQVQEDIELAMAAIIAWAEVLWKNDEKLLELVVPGGVVAYMERIDYSSQTMRTKFSIHIALTSRPMYIGQKTDTSLILFPLAGRSKLLHDLDIAPVLVPDEELLAFLSLTHYVSRPIK